MCYMSFEIKVSEIMSASFLRHIFMSMLHRRKQVFCTEMKITGLIPAAASFSINSKLFHNESPLLPSQQLAVIFPREHLLNA